jgi:hypothetical protein
VTGTFIIEVKIHIVENALWFNGNMLMLEKVGQPVEFLLSNISVNDYYCIAEFAAFNQIVSEQKLQLMKKYKGSAG